MHAAAFGVSNSPTTRNSGPQHITSALGPSAASKEGFASSAMENYLHSSLWLLCTIYSDIRDVSPFLSNRTPVSLSKAA